MTVFKITKTTQFYGCDNILIENAIQPFYYFKTIEKARESLKNIYSSFFNEELISLFADDKFQFVLRDDKQIIVFEIKEDSIFIK